MTQIDVLLETTFCAIFRVFQNWVTYSYIKTYLTSTENCNKCDDDFVAYTDADMELFRIAFAADCSALQRMRTT